MIQQHLPQDSHAKQMDCIFCQIIAGTSPATVHFQDADIIVISNKLQWVPIMLIGMPREHLTQDQLWEGNILSHIGQALVELGRTHAPGGFRLISNFGRDAMQSQEHGHVHLLGGTSLGPYA